MCKLTILDVGHGNCAVFIDDDGTVIVDGGRRGGLMNYLVEQGITVVDAVLISHADADHIGGLIDLFLSQEIQIATVYLNSDAIRDTQLWEDLRIALSDRYTHGITAVIPDLTSNANSNLARAHVRFEIVHPDPVLVLAGPGGTDTSGNRLTANRMSAVIRLVSETNGEILLTGDMDSYALDTITSKGKSITASVLVFPHHGGLPGSADVAAFTTDLCAAVQPALVVFCNGHGRFDNPRREVVDAVVSAVPNAHIACTQLCQLCMQEHLDDTPLHETTRQDVTTDYKCAGTIEIRLGLDEIAYLPDPISHRNHIDRVASSALCRRLVTPIASVSVAPPGVQPMSIFDGDRG